MLYNLEQRKRKNWRKNKISLFEKSWMGSNNRKKINQNRKTIKQFWKTIILVLKCNVYLRESVSNSKKNYWVKF